MLISTEPFICKSYPSPYQRYSSVLLLMHLPPLDYPLFTNWESNLVEHITERLVSCQLRHILKKLYSLLLHMKTLVLILNYGHLKFAYSWATLSTFSRFHIKLSLFYFLIFLFYLSLTLSTAYLNSQKPVVSYFLSNRLQYSALDL